MKNKTRFVSQLLMYSDTTNVNVDSWFNGNVIYELDLDTHEFDEVIEAELIMMTELVFDLICEYKKLTVVVNYNENGLLMACLTGHYKIFMLHGENDYKKLDDLHNAFSDYFEAHSTLIKTNGFASNSLHSVKQIASSKAMPYINKVHTTTKKLIKLHDVIIDEFNADLNNNFSACKNY